jgi:hypothetical protein
MAFDNAALIPLIANSGFTLWLYRTTDTRADALAAGYFAGASARLQPGDVMFLQASDALTLTTVRSGTVVPGGVLVDTAAVPFRVNRSSAQRFSVRQLATAIAMTLMLLPTAPDYAAGGTIPAQATVSGPIAQVDFSISDAGGTTVQGPQTATVSAGTASASLPAPAIGTGYRLRVVAVGYPMLTDVSAPFSVSAGTAFTLLTEAGSTLTAENGNRILV